MPRDDKSEVSRRDSSDIIGYEEFLTELKTRISSAQLRAAVAVNKELVLLYWQIGRDILNRQHQQGWGAKVITRLAADLQKAFPEMKGFSVRNLKYMRAFAEAYPDEQLVQEVLALISWYHNLALLEKLKSPEERLWYVQQTIQHGWSRNVLVHQIESKLYHRQGKATTNFNRTLPQPQSELAQQLLKDPYTFDFLNLGEDFLERDLERALINHIRDFLIELGVGFAFVGSQYHLEVGGEDFYIDLLFYHLRLRCYIVIDLKIEEFKPEYSGKMNFYVSAVDDLLKHPDDQPTIGMILCKSKNKVIAEYSLRDMHKPIGVSVYQLKDTLPEALQGNLPTIEQLEAELQIVSIIE
ncbi:PDDEXK nuclease domain-containing protein [Nostoc sp. CALU 1950]|uniref:PDDEXK nuclease domain-containing protein n=1 Tax=Nostoc sp. CALU 1950 TaxID=3104321 RepID=UPI003EB75727